MRKKEQLVSMEGSKKTLQDCGEIKILLYSGGMDSYLIKHLWNPDLCFYVNVESQYSRREITNIRSAGMVPNQVKVVRGASLSRYERLDSIIPYRNIYLILSALNELEKRYPLEKQKLVDNLRRVRVCLGATSGDRVLDKSVQFANYMSDLLTFLNQQQHWTGVNHQEVIVDVPFKSATKRDLLRAYCDSCNNAEERQLKLELAWRDSFSCYNPKKNGEPCWSCKPCFRKVVAFYLEGYKVPKQILDTTRKYIFNSGIWQQVKTGTYGRALEESDIIKFMELTDPVLDGLI